MSIFQDKTRIEKLNLDIDLRMHELLLDALNQEEWDEDFILVYMRAAYGKGYSDALNDRGTLIKTHYL